jgi:hypothetical protein
VLGMGALTTAQCYEIVLYAGGGVYRPIRDWDRWCPSSSSMNAPSLCLVSRCGEVKTEGSGSVENFTLGT